MMYINHWIGLFILSCIEMVLFGCSSSTLQPPVIKPSDNQLNLADIDAVKVIGKGSGGIVQLVRHKWTGQFFALKVN